MVEQQIKSVGYQFESDTTSLNFFDITERRKSYGKTLLDVTCVYLELQDVDVGKISNLIRRMHNRGVTTSEMVRALRRLLTIIDAAKHRLDYKKSESDNDITNLIIKYLMFIFFRIYAIFNKGRRR